MSAARLLRFPSLRSTPRLRLLVPPRPTSTAVLLGRHQSTLNPSESHPKSSSSSSSSIYTHVLAGIFGGGIVIVGAYAWYHFSGLKKIVSTSTSIHGSIKSAHASFAKKAQSSAVLGHLRSLTKSYAAIYPGGATLVDKAFDSFDVLAATHAEKVDEIAANAYADLSEIALSSDSNDVKIRKGASIVRRASSELLVLGEHVRHHALDSAFENHPEIKEMLEDRYNSLVSLAVCSLLSSSVFPSPCL